MSLISAAIEHLRAVPYLTVFVDAPLAPHTRFEIGGPAAVFADTFDKAAFIEALRAVQGFAIPRMVIGGGTNLIVADAGFDGIVLRFTGPEIVRDGMVLHIEAGAGLQDVVDQSITLGLKGLETMTGIPGYLGGAIYGNAGAYGHSIQELVEAVYATDGQHVRAFCNEECRFRYRDSIFKANKEWIILSADLRFREGDPDELARIAAEIRTIRDAKYPPSMKCAGSIFKNLLFAEMPEHVRAVVPATCIREGKVPSAWFLEQVEAKGMRRGNIQVAPYHANLIYNDDGGCAADLVAIIHELKQRVRKRFGLELEEEVQYIGFEYAPASV